ncbi:MAG: hypothetical protein ACOYMS_02465 [Terrimicrobiaceae bacterium]
MKIFSGLVFALIFATTGFAQEEIIDATNLEALRAKDGVEVTVEGTVTEVGTTKESTITFINIGAPKKQGFVAVVFQKSYAAFPEGFDKFRNQKVRVKGLLKLYRGETPQIELSTPEQITLVTE